MSDSTQSSIASRLRAYVDASYENAVQFASHCNLPYRTIQNYLRGDREPSASALQKIGAVTSLNIHWLITGRGVMNLSERPKHDWNIILFTYFLHEIIDICTDKNENILSEKEKFNLLAYLGYINICEMGYIYEVFGKEGLLKSKDDLPRVRETLKLFTESAREEWLKDFRKMAECQNSSDSDEDDYPLSY